MMGEVELVTANKFSAIEYTSAGEKSGDHSTVTAIPN